jgi:hypothetical protein
VLLLIAGWIGAIVGYALWKNFTTPRPQPAPLPTPTPLSVAPTPIPASPTPPPVNTATAYQDAVAKRAQAERLAQTAQSGDDWGLVVSQWQQAIALLEAVPADSPDYTNAQAQLPGYQTKLADAEQRAASQPAVTNAPPPSTTFTVSSDIACPAVSTTPESKPLELTNVQFSEPAAADSNQGEPGQPPQSGYIVGCITNHSAEAIASVSISYQGGSADNPNLIQSGLSPLSFSNLAPGQTAPFRGTFEVSPEVTSLNIQAIYWTPPGAATQQEIPLPLALTR